jgi:hypothetical protein
LITKALGEENLAFLKTKAHDEGVSGSDLAHILVLATRMARDADQRYAILSLHESYRTVLDFEGRLGEPRVSCPDQRLRTVSEITIPRGDSVQLLRSSIQHLADTIDNRAGVLSCVRDEIALTRATVAEAPLEVPAVVDVEPAQPVALPPHQKNKKPPLTKTIATQLKRVFGSFTINLAPAVKILGGALQLIAPLVRGAQSVIEETKEAARGNTILKNTLSKVAGSLRPLFEFSIQGHLEGLAHQALGTLSARSALSRYAQTGSSRPSGESPGGDGESGMSAEAREALFRFLLDFGKIRSFFSENRHIMGRSEWFYIKEAQVVTDHEGRMERLDTYLQKTPEGRALFDLVYQPVSIPSTTSRRHVTIPIAPGVETSLPVPPNCVITAMEFLDARGERIEQPERHSARVCIAGGAIVTPPLDARMVAYSIVWEPNRPLNPEGAYPGPRALTPVEFEKLRAVLPRVGFDLGEEMEIAYSMIRKVGDPELRAALAAHVEGERKWIYTMDSMVREFQRAAGSAFLESVYHMRAGICDSMSAVGAHLMGSAIGLPGIVVSGPTQERGYFDLRTGHSIAEGLLPESTTTFDITEISKSSDRHTGARVPVHTQAALSRALTNPHVTRREVASIYQDLGDLVRGVTPQRYTGRPDPNQRPRTTWRDRLLPAELKEANKHSENTPDTDESSIKRAVVYATAVTWFDRIAQRSPARGDAGELCWFIRERASDVPAAPFLDATTVSELGVHRDLVTLVSRDIHNEVTQHLVTAIRSHRIPPHEMARLPETTEFFTFNQSLAVVEALVATGANLDTASSIADNLKAKIANAFETEVRNNRIDEAVAVCERMTALLRNLHASNHLTNSQEFAKTLGSLFEVSRWPFKSPISADELSRCTQSMIDLIEMVFKVGGEHSATLICLEIAEDEKAREGFDALRGHAPTEMRRALSVHTPEGAQALTSAFIAYLSASTASVAKVIHLVDRLETLVPHCDLSAYAPQVRNATRGLIERYIKDYSDGYSYTFLINWPSDENPASSLFFMSAPQSNGGLCIQLLRTFTRLGALVELEARSMWPQKNEREIIRDLINNTSLRRGGWIEGRRTSKWNVGEMPDVLREICQTSMDPSVPTTMSELLKWRREEGQGTPLPEERHFKKIIEMRGGVPDSWNADSHTDSLAEAIATFVQGTLSNQEIYRALHVVGPRVIPPSDEALDPEFSKNLSELARSLRGAPSSAEAVEILQAARTFTKRSPMEVVPDVPGIAAACSILDIAHKLGVSRQLLGRVSSQWDPISHVTLNGRDDGSLPDGQVWRNALGVSASASPPALEHVTVSIKLLREAFSSLPLAARHKLRSPLYQYTSSELGRVRIVGNSGSPEATRAYQPGDSRREINWRISGRDGQDKLWMKVREEREERSLTLVVDLTNLRADLRRYENADNRSAQTVIEKAPTLSTIVHETMVAQEAGLTVDILFTHHAVILSKRDAAEFILNPSKDKVSREFWQSVLFKSARASERHDDEVRIFGLQGFDSGSPLKYGEVPLRRNSFVQFLLGSNSAREGARTSRALKARGHLVSFGVLPGLRTKSDSHT